jgi:hypothetical protein
MLLKAIGILKLIEFRKPMVLSQKGFQNLLWAAGTVSENQGKLYDKIRAAFRNPWLQAAFGNPFGTRLAAFGKMLELSTRSLKQPENTFFNVSGPTKYKNK